MTSEVEITACFCRIYCVEDFKFHKSLVQIAADSWNLLLNNELKVIPSLSRKSDSKELTFLYKNTLETIFVFQVSVLSLRQDFTYIIAESIMERI